MYVKSLMIRFAIFLCDFEAYPYRMVSGLTGHDYSFLSVFHCPVLVYSTPSLGSGPYIHAGVLVLTALGLTPHSGILTACDIV
jgi:hypothetical protein